MATEQLKRHPKSGRPRLSRRLLLLVVASFLPAALVRVAVRGGVEEDVRADIIVVSPDSADLKPTAPGALSPARVVRAYGKLPLSFEPCSTASCNGQSEGRFVSRANGYTVLIAPDEATFAFQAKQDTNASTKTRFETRPARIADAKAPTNRRSAVLRMRLLGANRAARMSAEQPLPGKTSYFIGRDASHWRAGIPQYAKVRAEHVYPGIDLVYYGNQQRLEYDFLIESGRDPRQVRLQLDGPDTVKLTDDGDLDLSISGSRARLKKPFAYQKVEGVRREIACRYVVYQGHQIGFDLGDYDRSRPLVIDPVLVYSTYLGSSGGESVTGIAADAQGNAYVVGTTSAHFPTTPGAVQEVCPGGVGNPCHDLFVAKLNAAGDTLLFSTFLGGSLQDSSKDIAVDAAGNVYVAGFTLSSNFPTTAGAFQTTFRGGSFWGDAFVAKLNRDGSALLYSTYLGGTENEAAIGITVDRSGNAYVAGATRSTDFPTRNAIQAAFAGNGVEGQGDGFVAALNRQGSALVYSTYLGGSSDDQARDIAVDASGSVYVTGTTSSHNFPVVAPMQAALGGDFDAFVVKVGPAGALTYSTYLGGSGIDIGDAIAVDAQRNAYVAGETLSTNFPTYIPFQANMLGDRDAFLVKLNRSGSAFLYATYLGGNGGDGALAVAVDHVSSAHVIGWTTSTNFPLASPLQPVLGGFPAVDADAFVSRFHPSGTVIEFSTYVGGSNPDRGQTIALDQRGNIYAAGATQSSNFPTVRPLQPGHAGGLNDAFIAKIAAGKGP